MNYIGTDKAATTAPISVCPRGHRRRHTAFTVSMNLASS